MKSMTPDLGSGPSEDNWRQRVLLVNWREPVKPGEIDSVRIASVFAVKCCRRLTHVAGVQDAPSDR
jgi:hypothetical protein